MVQVTVAEDRLKMNGSIRIRAYNVDNKDGDADLDDNEKYIDMRFRMGMAITVAEGITANLRADFQDDTKWGNTQIGATPDIGLWGRPNSSGADIEVDRAYIRIERDMFIYQGGHIFQGFGVPGFFSAYAPQQLGMALRLKLPVIVDLNYWKLDEGTSLVDEEDDQKDTDMYGVQAQYKNDMLTAGLFYAMAQDTDGSEKQIVEMPHKFAGMEPHEAFWGHNDGVDPLHGTLFNPSGDGAGVTAFDVYAEFKAMENLKFRGQIGYFMPQDDDEDLTLWNSSTLIQGVVTWTFAPKCDLLGGFWHRTDDVDDDPVTGESYREDAELGMMGLLQIAW
jgi:hypothetical protein